MDFTDEMILLQRLMPPKLCCESVIKAKASFVILQQYDLLQNHVLIVLNNRDRGFLEK